MPAFSRDLRDLQNWHSKVKDHNEQEIRVMVIHSGLICVRWLLLLGALSALTFPAGAQLVSIVFPEPPEQAERMSGRARAGRHFFIAVSNAAVIFWIPTIVIENSGITSWR